MKLIVTRAWQDGDVRSLCAALSAEGDLILGDSAGTVHILNIDNDDSPLNAIENAHAVRYLLTGSGVILVALSHMCSVHNIVVKNLWYVRYKALV